MDDELDKLWGEHNTKINTIIGKLMVPAMNRTDPQVTEAHQDLINFANWFDEEMEKLYERE